MSRVFVAGATGYIGQHVVRELVARGHEVVCLARPRSGVDGRLDEDAVRATLAGAEVRFGDVTSERSVREDGFRGEPFDATFSCLATRTGEPRDAWAIEHEANEHVLQAAADVGCERFVLLSAICVQKPVLPFQRAKLAFERSLQESGLTWSIVRPTAFFKSLAGQVGRVKAGKPFLVFGDGELTACKPIGESDLARFMVDCLANPAKANAILPIGGPGPAITPKAQAELLFALLGQEPKIKRVPVALMSAIIGGLAAGGLFSGQLRAKAELARIGRFYGTESMLLWKDGRYDADATPSFGTETLRDFYERVLREGLAGQELGDHAVF